MEQYVESLTGLHWEKQYREIILILKVSIMCAFILGCIATICIYRYLLDKDEKEEIDREIRRAFKDDD